MQLGRKDADIERGSRESRKEVYPRVIKSDSRRMLFESSSTLGLSLWPRICSPEKMT